MCPQSATPCGNASGRQVALDGGKKFSGKVRAEFVVGMPGKPCAQIFFRLAAGEIVAKQALDRFRDQRRGAAKADRARDGAHAGRPLRPDRSNRRR